MTVADITQPVHFILEPKDADQTGSSQETDSDTASSGGDKDEWFEEWTPEGYVYYWNAKGGECTYLVAVPRHVFLMFLVQRNWTICIISIRSSNYKFSWMHFIFAKRTSLGYLAR